MNGIKFLADVNIEKPIVDFLSRQGYDIKWIPEYNCQMTDEDLLELANKEKRVLITNDKDFGELVFFQRRVGMGIILFRVKGQSTKEKVKLIRKLLMSYPEKVSRHFVVLTKNKIRIIPLGD